jgi:hypothetical protein
MIPTAPPLSRYFADRGLFCAGRVEAADLDRVARATGAVIQTTVNGLEAGVLGRAGDMEERQVGGSGLTLAVDGWQWQWMGGSGMAVAVDSGMAVAGWQWIVDSVGWQWIGVAVWGGSGLLTVA